MKLSIVEKSFPTPDSVTLRFKPDNTLDDYKPGQHGVFTFNVNGENITSQEPRPDGRGIEARANSVMPGLPGF